LNNYPAPNTFVTTKDDIKVWKVALCDSCVPSGYKEFLLNRIRTSLKMLGLCSLLLALAVAGIYWDAATTGPYFMRVVLAIALTIASIFGVIGVPSAIVILLVNLARLRRLSQTGTVDAKNEAQSFIGEGERLIKKMEPIAENHQSTEVDPNFPLPKFRGVEYLQMADKEKEKLINRRGKRSIVAVGITFDDLDKALPQDWQSILKNAHSAEIGKRFVRLSGL